MSHVASAQPYPTGCSICLPIIPLLWHQWGHLSVRTGQAPCQTYLHETWYALLLLVAGSNSTLNHGSDSLSQPLAQQNLIDLKSP